jgi:hypothetical protein
MASKILKNTKSTKGKQKLSTTQIVFYVFCIILVISMVLSLFINV